MIDLLTLLGGFSALGCGLWFNNTPLFLTGAFLLHVVYRDDDDNDDLPATEHQP